MAFQQDIQFMDGAFVAPTFADWQGRAAALGLKRSGRELVGACPACGGNDRFAVKPVEGGTAVVHCRQCQGFIDIVNAAGLAEDRPTNGAAPVTVYEYRDPSGNLYHRVSRQGEGPDKRPFPREAHSSAGWFGKGRSGMAVSRKIARARLHFQAMGFDGTQPIHPFIGFPPEELDPYEWNGRAEPDYAGGRTLGTF